MKITTYPTDSQLDITHILRDLPESEIKTTQVALATLTLNERGIDIAIEDVEGGTWLGGLHVEIFDGTLRLDVWNSGNSADAVADHDLHSFLEDEP